ncbi:MAG: dihydroorotase, partial [Acidimicrobiia bacterium]
MIAIRGGQVMTAQGWVTGDVLVEGGQVTGVGPGQEAEIELDATGCLVGPGLVDLHTHLREPGQTWKEDIASGSAAAVAGGFSAVVAMPNTDPPVDSPEVVDSVLAAGVQAGLVDVIAAGALTKGRAGASPADIDGMYRVGVRLFTDDGDSVADDDMLGQVMTTIARLPGALVAQHAEDTSATTGAHMHEGVMSRRLGVGGMAAETEADVVRRDLSLAAATGVRYHCQHVSAMMTIELIRAAKDQGLAVTAEVTPHHLTFDESALDELDADFKMYPPLRSSQDRQALVAALRDGTIDAVATDHAPHLPEEKSAGFAAAPR